MSDDGARESEDLLVHLAERARDQLYGKYRGKVSTVGTDEHLGQIRAKVPSVYGGEDESPWALPSVPFAGKKHGLVALPEVDDGVWIEFEAGQASHPIWTGFWWARDELPSPGDVAVRVFATSHGHQLVLDDDNDELKLIHGSGPSIVITQSDITLTVGSHKIVIGSDGVTINDGAFKVQ